MKHKAIPLYAFTYNLEFPQFIFADRAVTTTDNIDRSTAATSHTQFIANQMRIEGLKNTVTFTDPSKRFAQLIENKESGSINYYSGLTDITVPTGYSA